MARPGATEEDDGKEKKQNFFHNGKLLRRGAMSRTQRACRSASLPCHTRREDTETNRTLRSTISDSVWFPFSLYASVIIDKSMISASFFVDL